MQILIIGNGFVGSSIARKLRDEDNDVTLAARHCRDEALPWIQCDATDRAAFQNAIQKTNPDVLILSHGPSDITWCNEHPEKTMKTHQGIAQNAISLLPDTYKILISTDNVFDGVAEINSEDSPTHPTNAYGIAKLAAEDEFIKNGENSLILRASLVYGWENFPNKPWINFFTKCVSLLSKGESIDAPIDHWNTPILASNLATALFVLLQHKRRGLFHLAGPDRISRFDWAKVIADVFELNQQLINPVKKANSRFACRATNSCLNSVRLNRLPEFKSFSFLDVYKTAKQLKENKPDWL